MGTALLPWIACAVLAAVCIALLVKVFVLRHAAKEIGQELADRLETDTNTLLSLSTRDRAMRALANRLNRELRLLRRERRRYQQGDRELKKAITNISHDLRTPLTAICGYLDLLEREPLSENAARYLALIENRTQALKQLTEELFRYSVVQSVSATMHPEPLCLNRALEESLAAHYAALRTAGITPEIHMPEKEVRRMLDAAALSRIFSNILSNAIKYSDGDLAISLSDSGEITFANRAAQLDDVQAGRLFQRFYTVETGANATGLGLSIAKTLTEKLGGEISACYRDGKLRVRMLFPVTEATGRA